MPAAPKVKMPRAKADKIVKKVEKHLKPFVDRQMACGSYRRGAQMIGDIDFVVIPKEGVTLPQMLPPNDGINWLGDNKAQVVIDGEKVDFKVTTPDAWGATILYFTGPADFNIKYRWMAKKRGMKLNEYGLWDRKTDAYIAGATEQDIYDALKRPFRDPDQRKGWKAESNYIDYDNWHEDRETMHEEKWKLYKQQGGKTPITNKTSKRDRKLLNDIMEKLGIDYEPKKYVIDNPTMAYRAMPFTDYAKALEIGYLYPPKQGIFASLNPTPTKAQASWKGYPVFEIDITGLTVTFKGKQGDEQGRIITIDEPISVDRILHYGKNSYEGWEAEYQPNQQLSDYTPQSLMTSSAITGDYAVDSLKYSQTTWSAESFNAENRWITGQLTALLSERARTLKDLIDELGIRGITVESNLNRNPNFRRVGTVVPAIWGLKELDYSVRHPYPAITQAEQKKEYLRSLFRTLNPNLENWDEIEWTGNPKIFIEENDWGDDVEWTDYEE